MKKPAGVVPIPLYNPELGDVRCLLAPGRAARFCQITLQSLGSRLDSFTRRNALNPSFVARLLAEKEALSWADEPWARYRPHLERTLAKLGYPSTLLWLSATREEKAGKKEVFWVLRLTTGKAKRLAGIENEFDTTLRKKAA